MWPLLLFLLFPVAVLIGMALARPKTGSTVLPPFHAHCRNCVFKERHDG